MKQNIAIFGSTGSIGTQTLDVIRKFPDKFRVFGLACYKNAKLLEQQSREFNPEIATTYNEEAWINLATSADKIVFASSGTTALNALMAAIDARKQILLANKELLVVAGEKIMSRATKNQIIPIDSEHSAIFQCLQGENPKSIEKIILTCSGGPFYGKNRAELKNVTVKEALQHPVWSMSKKITIDSATLMNKAFEIIEAKHLFGVSAEQIEVVIHPEGIVHSMVQFKDGSIKAQLGTPNMRTPITYALFYPERAETDFPRLDFTNLSFLKPDFNTFQGPKIAFEAMRRGGNALTAMVTANDEAVQDFLKGKCSFLEIYERIHRALDDNKNESRHENISA